MHGPDEIGSRDSIEQQHGRAAKKWGVEKWATLFRDNLSRF